MGQNDFAVWWLAAMGQGPRVEAGAPEGGAENLNRAAKQNENHAGFRERGHGLGVQQSPV